MQCGVRRGQVEQQHHVGVQEHTTALRFFQRAIHLAPTYTYAYTLAGHEYFANEDLEKADSYYQHAIRHDARHYNAWSVGT